MTKTETAQLLTLIAAFDRRTIGEADVEAWHLIVADLEPEDCAAAVKHHYATKRDWLMPADVRASALMTARQREGRERLAAIEAEIAAENAGQLRARPIAALAVGQPIPSPDYVRGRRAKELAAAVAAAKAERVEPEEAS